MSWLDREGSSSQDREALAAWHQDRSDTLRWQPPCRRCARDAMCRVILMWEVGPGTYEEGKQIPACKVHRDAILDGFDGLRVTAPDAVAGLVVTLGAP